MSEVALAVVLLILASLMVQTVRNLQRLDPGFQSQGLLTFRVELGWRAYGTLAKTMDFQTRMLDGLAALPGVETVGFDGNLWLSGKPREPAPIVVEGQSIDAQRTSPFVHWHFISPSYLQTMKTPLVVGPGLHRRRHRRRDVRRARERPARAAAVAERGSDRQPRIGRRRRRLRSEDMADGCRRRRRRAASAARRRDGAWTCIDRSGRSRLAAAGSSCGRASIRQAWRAARRRLSRGPIRTSRPSTCRPCRTESRPESGNDGRRARSSLAFAGIAALLSAIGLYSVLTTGLAAAA